MIKKNLKVCPSVVLLSGLLLEGNSAILATRDAIKRCLFIRYNDNSD
jgi:hypothetical protein